MFDTVKFVSEIRGSESSCKLETKGLHRQCCLKRRIGKFPWPPLEAALLISKFFCSKTFFEKELTNQGALL